MILRLAIYLFAFCSFIQTVKAEKDDSKGLFIMQVSWNKESFGDESRVEIIYKSKGKFTKNKISTTDVLRRYKKNEFIDLNLKSGEYELHSIALYDEDLPPDQFYRILIDKQFVIEENQVTNAGMFFLSRETKNSNTVLPLVLNNTNDVDQFLRNYNPDYFTGSDNIIKPWKFLSDEVLIKIKNEYVASIVESLNNKPKNRQSYFGTTQGIIFKIDQDESGQITNYKLIPTPTLQEVIDLQILNNGRLLATLSNGSFLFGNLHGMGFIKLPEGLERYPTLKSLKNGRSLIVDRNCNIFHTVEENFKWEKYDSYHIERNEGNRIYRTLAADSQTQRVKIYQGNKYFYLYHPSDDQFPNLIRGSYENLNYENLPVPESLGFILSVYETSTHLIITPYSRNSKSIPGYVYIKEDEEEKWTMKALPEGICTQFFPGKDDSIWYSQCEKVWYETVDFGTSWQIWNSDK